MLLAAAATQLVPRLTRKQPPTNDDSQQPPLTPCNDVHTPRKYPHRKEPSTDTRCPSLVRNKALLHLADKLEQWKDWNFLKKKGSKTDFQFDGSTSNIITYWDNRSAMAPTALKNSDPRNRHHRVHISSQKFIEALLLGGESSPHGYVRFGHPLHLFSRPLATDLKKFPWNANSCGDALGARIIGHSLVLGGRCRVHTTF